MTKRYATNSWQAREALASREPYNTHGAMWATDDPTRMWSAGRLPNDPPGEWRDRYLNGWRDNEITYVVYSYQTPIAWVYVGGLVMIPDVKYSVTTTGHQSMLYALQRPSDSFADAAQGERQQARERAAQRRDDATWERSNAQVLHMTRERTRDHYRPPAVAAEQDGRDTAPNLAYSEAYESAHGRP